MPSKGLFLAEQKIRLHSQTIKAGVSYYNIAGSTGSTESCPALEPSSRHLSQNSVSFSDGGQGTGFLPKAPDLNCHADQKGRAFMAQLLRKSQNPGKVGSPNMLPSGIQSSSSMPLPAGKWLLCPNCPERFCISNCIGCGRVPPGGYPGGWLRLKTPSSDGQAVVGTVAGGPA